MRTQLLEARESMYLLSVEQLILYLAAFGLLSLKTDNLFSVGMAYPAILCTFLLAFALPALGLLFAAVGSDHGHRAVIAS